VVVKRTKITSRGEILRFEKEVALLLACSHPNVVQPLALMRAPPTYAFVMPLFAHGSLFGVLHNSGRQLSLQGALSVLADVSSAVAHLHEVGVLHRDVKSDNVLLDGSWRAVLVDFNASERTADVLADIVAPSRPSGGFFKQFVVGTPSFSATRPLI
jgi:serine/threonine protein kinase